MRRLRALALGALAVAASACSKGPHTTGPAAHEVRFSVLSTESSQNMASYWEPILKDMEAQTGLKVIPYYSTNYTLLVEAMKAKKTDAGWFSNRSGLEAVRRGDAEVFARTVNASADAGYRSVLIVGAKSGLDLAAVLKCGKRLTFGFGDALSTSGTLAPNTYLFAPKNIDPQTCFKQVRSGQSHQANLFAVAKGQLDVATNNTTSLMMNEKAGGAEANAVKVIWESPVLPEDPIVWRKDLDPALKEKLRQFFLTYGQGTGPEADRQRAKLKRLNVAGFKPAGDEHLLMVKEMEATDLWQQARKTGDAAKIAAAKSNLDAITAQREALEGRTRAPAAAQ